MHSRRTQIQTDPALLLLLQRQREMLVRAHRVAVHAKKAVKRLTSDQDQDRKNS
jgi:hypothetical protein